MGMFSICSDGTHSMSCLLSTPGSEQTPEPQTSLRCPEWKVKRGEKEEEIVLTTEIRLKNEV